MTAVSERKRLPGWLAPALAAGLLLAMLAAILLFARRSAATDVPPAPPPFAAPPATALPVLDVQQAGEGRLTLSDGSRDMALAPGVAVERLRPASAGEMRPGEWLAIIGVPNEVRNLSIRSLVLIAGALAPDADGVARSPAGFAGHETARDPRERPMLGGTIERIEGNRLTLRTATGTVSVDLTPAAPLRRLEPASSEIIREGDRLAYRPSARPGPAGATDVLVLTEGAR